jgi:hypothetical protein
MQRLVEQVYDDAGGAEVFADVNKGKVKESLGLH